MHAVVVHLREHERRALTVGGPEERGTHAQCPLEGVLGPVELRVTRIEPTPIVMVVRVIRRAAGRRRSSARGDVRAGVDRLAHLEERALDAVVVEDVG